VRAYAEVFHDWLFLDLPLDQATALVSCLVERGAGFACTSEPGVGRRIYYASTTADEVVRAWLDGTAEAGVSRETSEA